MPTTADRRLTSEAERLAALAPDFSSERGFNARLIDFRFEAIEPWIAGAGRCLELGCADGRMTGPLAAAVEKLTAVDGSDAYVAAVRERLPHVEAVTSLFECYEPAEAYDAIVMAHILEHVADPAELLARAAGWLAPEGRIVVSVPNAGSLHREVGVAMGMLRATTELNEADRSIGHRRVYTRETLLADVATAGLRPEHVGGVYLKPLSNAQIEADWSEDLIRAFHEVGKRHPELCAELLVVARSEPC